MKSKIKAPTRLWDKGDRIDDLMRELTVGNDPEIDREFVVGDAIGSAAHAHMLRKCGYLSKRELSLLLRELKRIYRRGVAREFLIDRELEDVHTAIESCLVAQCGEAGRRIHTARSRNDQVILAVRLTLREWILELLASLKSVQDVLAQRFKEVGGVEMPGYTHMQPAMPSSVGMLIHAWYEQSLVLCSDGLVLFRSIDSNPLGGGAGFGTSLLIDRAFVSKLLGFSKEQRSPIEVNNSRGRYEERFLRWATDIGALFEKVACDIMLFTTREFGFFSLPNELTTGSSIMPQKRNCDIAELMRGRASKLRGALAEIMSLTAKLPSSYHREFQYTKEPIVRGFNEVCAILEMAGLLFKKIVVNKDRIEAAMYSDLFATYEANAQVATGIPFRDAYRNTALKLKSGGVVSTKWRKAVKKLLAESVKGMSAAVREARGYERETRKLSTRIRRVASDVFSD